MTTPGFSFAYTRRFHKEREEETIISSCNYCLATVADMSDDADLAIAEQQHVCSRKTKAIG